MDIKNNITHKIEIEFDGFKHNENSIKTNKCEICDWWGEEMCEEIDINSEIAKRLLPDRHYQINIEIVDIT